jgi:hypothetical protein
MRAIRLAGVERVDLKIDPYANDPGHWGASLATLAEIMFPCLEAVSPGSVAEVGAYAGDLTRLLLEWGTARGVRVLAIDPKPQGELTKLAEAHPELELVRQLSLEGLKTVALPDVVILDGDHNYYTVGEELRIIGTRAAESQAALPLVILHDVGWPHARRDSYYAPEEIPAEHRQPLAEGPGLYPGVTGVRPGGLPYHWAAENEGGPRNGVLTAAEDFVAARDGLRLAVIPAFFGFGAIWPLDAPYADALAAILDPWDRNPLLARLEENRVLHLASSHFQMTEAARQAQRNWRKDELLREMLKSRAFTLAERLSRLHQRGKPAFTREQVRELLEDR